MPLILSGNVASATAGGYEVANSCRFNDDDSAYMHKTCGTATLNTKFTISLWAKRGHISDSDENYIIWSGADVNNTLSLRFRADNKLHFYSAISGSDVINYKTTRLFRDPSAWYAITVAVDTTQGTAGNRVKIYINGTQETAFDDSDNPDEDTAFTIMTDNTFQVGRRHDNTSSYLDCYLAEVVFIDGTAYAASDFGEFDEDSPTIWKPKDVSGLTFGTNGFYLDFEASGNLGNDANGGTDLTEVNFAAADQATDTPTNNFCTLNPIDTATDSSATGSFKITEGNLVLGDSGSNDNDMGLRATMGVLGGKWYWEVKRLETGGTVGIVSSHVDITGGNVVNNDSVCSRNISSNGTGSSLVYWNNSTFTNDASLQGYAANDIIGVALDMDNGKLYFSINGTFKGFDNNASDPAAGTNANFTDIPTDKGFIMPYVEKRGSADPSDQFNFGGCPAFSVSSGNADGKGYGNFEYSPPSGFLALCTKNLGSTGG